MGKDDFVKSYIEATPETQAQIKEALKETIEEMKRKKEADKH